MATLLKQSTSVDLPIGPFLDETDGKTAETALTITQPDVRVKKNGGAWAQKNAAQTLTHEEFGWYEVTLDATDTDTVGQLMVAVHETGALPVWREFLVVPANVYDSLVGGSDRLQIDLQEWIGVAPLALASQLVQVSVSALVTDAITAASIQASAITGAKIGTDAITATKIAQGATDEIAGAVWDRLRASHVVEGSFGQALQLQRSGTAQAGAAGSITLDASASAVNDFYKDAVVLIVSGAGAGQARRISGYVGSTKVASVSPNWATNPDNTSVFVIRPAVVYVSVGGAGALQRTIGVTVSGNPLEGASVWVATDSAGTNIVAGALTTSSQGTVTVLLDAGSYYVWVQKDGYQAIAGQAITVS